jgi:hypothetical protein
MAAEPLLHRDFDHVDCLLATSADCDDLDGRTRLVGRRDQDATTRELQLEGDAPGRFEDVHRRLLALVPARLAADAAPGDALPRTPNPVSGIDECGVIERK